MRRGLRSGSTASRSRRASTRRTRPLEPYPYPHSYPYPYPYPHSYPYPYPYHQYAEIWEKEGAVPTEEGALRVLHEIGAATMAKTGTFINCEDGLQIPW